MKFYQLIISSLLLLFAGCNPAEKKQTAPRQAAVAAADPVEGSSILQLDKRLLAADSLVFVFYKDPHGKDSLRYTRYYTQYSSTNTALIRSVLQALNDSTERLERIKKCHSEGKIWCYRSGNIFQTIYFSAHNKDCSFVYIIKNGQFYYSKLAGNLAVKLAELKGLAKEPKVEQR